MENNLSKAISQIKFPVRYEKYPPRIVDAKGFMLLSIAQLNESTNEFGHALAEMINGLDGRGNDFKWDDNSVIDFVNWYVKLNRLDFRYTLENRYIIDSFKKGDKPELWHMEAPDRQVKSAEAAREFLIRELNMTPTQADTLYEPYIAACEKYAQQYK